MEKLVEDWLELAQRHIRDILSKAVEYSDAQNGLVVFDGDSDLSRVLVRAYRRALSTATFLDFNSVTPQAVLTAFELMSHSDLVVLIQSNSFRLDAFRIRVELFKRGLKVIEHPHLDRMKGQEIQWYIDALAYDPKYYRDTGRALKGWIDRAQSAIVDSGGESLFFESGFESAKLNVGDYREMKNVGGQFPIGEVFTEAKDLEAVHGRIRIFIFADLNFMVNRPPVPITLVIEKGRVREVIDTTLDFEKVLTAIRADEGEVWVREFGFGMNRAFSKDRVVKDIGTLERMCGVHLSLGAKHAVYQKPDFRRRHVRHHVDVFVVTETVQLDGVVVFSNGQWIV